jgi:hypothetical protein
MDFQAAPANEAVPDNPREIVGGSSRPLRSGKDAELEIQETHTTLL